MYLLIVLSLGLWDLSETSHRNSGDPLFKLNYAAQGTSFGVMSSFLILSEAVIKPSLHQAPNCTLGSGNFCDPAQLNGWDRGAVGNSSGSWRFTSDMGQLAALILPALGSSLDALQSDRMNWRDAFDDSLVIYNTTLAATTVGQVLKYAIRRPRPTQYVENPKGGFEQQLSFPSGHVTAVAAATTAYATVFSLRHPKSPWRYVIYAAAALTTTLTAVGRVEGGRHFNTDVLGGALLGAGIGFLIPYAEATWLKDP